MIPNAFSRVPASPHRARKRAAVQTRRRDSGTKHPGSSCAQHGRLLCSVRSAREVGCPASDSHRTNGPNNPDLRARRPQLDRLSGRPPGGKRLLPISVRARLQEPSDFLGPCRPCTCELALIKLQFQWIFVLIAVFAKSIRVTGGADWIGGWAVGRRPGGACFNKRRMRVEITRTESVRPIQRQSDGASGHVGAASKRGSRGGCDLRKIASALATCFGRVARRHSADGTCRER